MRGVNTTMGWRVVWLTLCALLVVEAHKYNFQTRLPKQLHLADVGGPTAEWVLGDLARSTLFVVNPDVRAVGRIAHRLSPGTADGGLLLHGAFLGGDLQDKDVICVSNVEKNFVCFKALDKKLEQVLSQPVFCTDQVLVGEFTGAGGEDILDLSTAQLHHIANGASTFSQMPLADDAKALVQKWYANKDKLQLRAGLIDTGGNPSHMMCIVVADPQSGTVEAWGVHQADGKMQLQQAFAIKTAIRSNEVLSLGHARPLPTQDFAFHTPATGHLRVCGLQHPAADSSAPRAPPTLSCYLEVANEDSAGGESSLFWGRLNALAAAPVSSGDKNGAPVRVEDLLLHDGTDHQVFVANNVVGGGGALGGATATATAATATGSGGHSDSSVARAGGGKQSDPAAVPNFVWAYVQHVLDVEADPDEDGLVTFVELGGLINPKLNEYGASPFTKDIFVYLAWMKGTPDTSTKEVDTKVPEAALFLAISSLAAKGINLHIVQADNPVEPFVSCLGGTPFNFAEAVDPIKQNYFPKSMDRVFRFALSAYQYSCPGRSSGIARAIGSNDFVISLANWRELPSPVTDAMWAGTLLHELGHTIGLMHGSVDNVVFKPNDVSIMNYLYQMSGIFKDDLQQFLYSELNCDDVNEVALDEGTGIKCQKGSDDPSEDPTKHKYKVWLRKKGTLYDVNSAIDFNNNGQIDPAAVAVDMSGNSDGMQLYKGGVEEFSRLVFTGENMGDIPVSRLAPNSPPLPRSPAAAHTVAPPLGEPPTGATGRLANPAAPDAAPHAPAPAVAAPVSRFRERQGPQDKVGKASGPSGQDQPGGPGGGRRQDVTAPAAVDASKFPSRFLKLKKSKDLITNALGSAAARASNKLKKEFSITKPRHRAPLEELDADTYMQLPETLRVTKPFSEAFMTGFKRWQSRQVKKLQLVPNVGMYIKRQLVQNAAVHRLVESPQLKNLVIVPWAPKYTKAAEKLVSPHRRMKADDAAVPFFSKTFTQSEPPPLSKSWKELGKRDGVSGGADARRTNNKNDPAVTKDIMRMRPAGFGPSAGGGNSRVDKPNKL